MASVSSVLQRIKQDLSFFLPDESIVIACRNAGHRWRRCDLGPVLTLHLFILQVLHFNTAMTHLRHLSKKAVQAPAYCKARMRLPLQCAAGAARRIGGGDAQAMSLAPAIVVWTDGVSGGRLQHHRARHAGFTEGVWSAQRTEDRLRLSGAQGTGAVRCLQRADAAGAGIPAVHARAVEGVDAASLAGGG